MKVLSRAFWYSQEEDNLGLLSDTCEQTKLVETNSQIKSRKKIGEMLVCLQRFLKVKFSSKVL